MMNRKIPLLMYWVYAAVIMLLPVIALAGSKAVTVFYESTAVEGRSTIVIDPGHGGVDGGAVSCTGVEESEINLQIALRFRDAVNLLGIRTVMIRDSDTSVHTEGNTIGEKKVSDLKNRVRIADAIPGSVLVSIHQNYFSDSRYSGAQVFYNNNVNSKVFAKMMQDSMASSVNLGSVRESKSGSGIYLLENTKNVGILVECGFISNISEERKLLDPEYQKKLCCVMVSACSRYLCANPS